MKFEIWTDGALNKRINHMLNLNNVRKKQRNDSYIGARVTDELKEATEAWARDEGTTVSSLLTEVMRQLLIERGYLKKD